MIREIRLLLYFLIGVLLSAVSVLSYAETIAATASAPVLQYKCASGPYVVGTLNAACLAAGGTGMVGSYCYNGGTNLGTCTGVTQPVYSCPTGQNWMLAGSSCTRPDCTATQIRDSATGQCVLNCVAPYVLLNGVCSQSKSCFSIVVTPSGSCAMAGPCTAGEVAGLTFNQPICADSKPDPASGCPAGGIVVGMFASGKPICLSPPPSDPACTAAGGTITGTIGTTDVCSKAINPKCANGSDSIGTANGAPVCQDTCPAGSATGTLNGVTSCWPVGKVNTAGTQSKDSKTTTAKVGTGATSTTTVESSTTCTTSGTCATTTISTTDGVPTTTTATQSQTDFCTANPQDTNCAKGTAETNTNFCANHPLDRACQKTEKAECDPKTSYCGSGGTDKLYDPKNATDADAKSSMVGALASFNQTLMAAPFASAMTGFFTVTVPVGACPTWSGTIPYFNKGIDLAPYFCTQQSDKMMTMAGAVLMVIAAFAAYKWAVL